MSPSEPQGPDVESIQLSLDADGTGIVRSAAEATVAETDAATLARIEAARAEFEELPPDPAAPSSSTPWAVLTALDAMPALRARRLGRPGSRPADGVISFTVIEREALAHEQPLRVARALDRADRPRFVEERRRRCEWAHASTLARLRRDPRVHGVDVSWLTESIHVVADADAVFDIARWPGVERISPNAAVRSHSAFSGIGNRYVTRAAEEIEAGNLGRPSSGDRIHVAVIDRYWPHVGHAAFQESRTDETSRFTSALDCNQCFTQIFGICTAYGCRAPGREVPRPEVPHGTTVPFLIGGSIEEGQVSTIRGRDTRIARSGIASEVDFQSFVVADCDAIGRALQNAASSADVIAMAVTGDSVCSAAYDCGDLVRTIGAIASDGPLIVAPGGRGALVTSPTCNLSFPANLPGVLAVAAYDNESTVPLAYTAAPVALYSPTGGAPIRVTSREPPLSTISEMIGVTGPGLVTLFPDIRTREGFVVSTVRGTRGTTPSTCGSEYDWTARPSVHRIAPVAGASRCG